MKIKASKRGLTFSFKENESFHVGTHYRYIMDTAKGELRIVPDKNGKLKTCQKGSDHKVLFDIRNKEIKDLLSDATYLEIEFLDNLIAVHIIRLQNVNIDTLTDVEVAKMIDSAQKETIYIPQDAIAANEELHSVLKTAGFFSEKVQKDVSYIFDMVSLFSGAGMLDYPFHLDDSFNIKMAVDFDAAAVRTYKENIGDHIVQADMRNLRECDVPYADLIIGGVCCQGYSNANRAGNEKADKQKRLLIDDYIRIVKAKKPLIFCIENVPEFLTKENGMYLQKVINGLSEYTITYQIVKDSNVGGYTTRKRMILIGSRIGKVEIPNVEIARIKTAGEALRKVDSTWFNASDITIARPETIAKMAQVRPGHNYKDIEEMKHLDRHSNTYRRLADDKPAVTLLNWRKINMMPPKGNRILSVAEVSAMSGLGKSFKFLGTLNDRQQQVGNGVPYAIANFIKSIIKNALYCYANDTFSFA